MKPLNESSTNVAYRVVHDHRLRRQIFKIQLENFFNSDQSLLFWDPIEKFRFSTDRPIERLKANSITDFAQLLPKWVRVRSEFFFGDNRNLVPSNPIGNFDLRLIDRLNISRYIYTCSCKFNLCGQGRL